MHHQNTNNQRKKTLLCWILAGFLAALSLVPLQRSLLRRFLLAPTVLNPSAFGARTLLAPTAFIHTSPTRCMPLLLLLRRHRYYDVTALFVMTTNQDDPRTDLWSAVELGERTTGRSGQWHSTSGRAGSRSACRSAGMCTVRCCLSDHPHRPGRHVSHRQPMRRRRPRVETRNSHDSLRRPAQTSPALHGTDAAAAAAAK